MQELTKFEIDTHCVVVNQVLFPERGGDHFASPAPASLPTATLLAVCSERVSEVQRTSRHADEVSGADLRPL